MALGSRVVTLPTATTRPHPVGAGRVSSITEADVTAHRDDARALVGQRMATVRS